MVVHVYLPFGGISDETKRGIIDKLNQPNEVFRFPEPQIVMAPPLAQGFPDSVYPDHSLATLSQVVETELAYGRSKGRNAALFVWAQDSILQALDPTAQLIYAESPVSESSPLVVDEIRAEITQIAGVLNCVESGNQTFGECQEWAGVDGVVRGEKLTEGGKIESKALGSSGQIECGNITQMKLKTKEAVRYVALS
jgi:hypothetical protein